MKTYLVVLLLIVTACAPRLQASGSYVPPSGHFRVQLPRDWSNLGIPEHLLVSREDPFHQYIFVQERPYREPFEHINKRFHRGMLPHEAAQLVIDELDSDPRVLDLCVLENVPARIDGKDGFSLVFTYRNRKGLSYRTIYYGLLSEKGVYTLRYTASLEHYLDRDVRAFERMVSSFECLSSR